MKKKKGMSVGFVSFETMEQLQTATEVCLLHECHGGCFVNLQLVFEFSFYFLIIVAQELDGKSIGNKTLKVQDVIAGSYFKKTYSAMDLPQNTQKTVEDALLGQNADVTVSSNGTEDGDANEGDANEGNTALNDLASSGRTARDVVTPLAHMPYADQLERKRNSIMQILKKLVSIASFLSCFTILYFSF